MHSSFVPRVSTWSSRRSSTGTRHTSPTPLRIYEIVDSPCHRTLLAHTSPLSWEHIGFSGDFLWDQAAATAGRRRQLNFRRQRAAA